MNLESYAKNVTKFSSGTCAIDVLANLFDELQISEPSKVKAQIVNFQRYVTSFAPPKPQEKRSLSDRNTAHLLSACSHTIDELENKPPTQTALSTSAKTEIPVGRLIPFTQLFNQSLTTNTPTCMTMRQLTTSTVPCKTLGERVEIVSQFQIFMHKMTKFDPDITKEPKCIRLIRCCELHLWDLADSTPPMAFKNFPADITKMVVRLLDIERAFALCGEKPKLLLESPEVIGQYLSMLLNRCDEDKIGLFLKKFEDNSSRNPIRLSFKLFQDSNGKTWKLLPEMLLQIQKKFPNLQTLELDLTNYKTESDDFYSKVVSACPKIEAVIVKSNDHCDCDRARTVDCMLRSLPRSLKKYSIIITTSRPSGTPFEKLFDWCPEINTLTLRCPFNLESLFPESNNLNDLDVSGCRFFSYCTNPRPFSNLHIKRLNLNDSTSNTAFIAPNELPVTLEVLHLQAPKSQPVLTLDGNKLADLCTRCSLLQELDLSYHNEITKKSFSETVFPVSLKRLSLHACTIDKDGIKNILTCCPSMNYLDLTNCPYIDDAFRKVCDASTLSQLKAWAKS